MDDQAIDFVVTWVDGSDPKWLRERRKYANGADSDDGVEGHRFRDWGTLRYWFRGVETYAPWVRRVHFVTAGQIPSWLNTACPKLHCVEHRDYMPQECLPTFNSNAIELYFNRIPDLAERFVLFNDDMFITHPVDKENFFKNDLPRDCAILGNILSTRPGDLFPYTMVSDSAVLNSRFDKQSVIHEQRSKFFSPCYSMSDMAKNLFLKPFDGFSQFVFPHVCTSYIKSTFDEVWKYYPKLSETGSHRFRTYSDNTHLLMRSWQLCRGRFEPRSPRWGKHFELGLDEGYLEAIRNQTYPVICLNDSSENVDYEGIKCQIIEAFESVLPRRSMFERE